MVERPAAATADAGSLAARVREGLRIVLHHPYLAPALRCVTWVNAFTFMVSAVVLVFASRTLGLAAGTIGLALGLGAVGGVVGALTAAPVARRIGTGRAIARRRGALHAPAGRPRSRGDRSGCRRPWCSPWSRRSVASA